jgi:hypothetical protein
MGIKSYRDLRAWQSGMELVVMVYEISEKFPSKDRVICCYPNMRILFLSTFTK